MSFVNLHKHSQWSILDGAGNGDQYAKLAAEKGQHALALTDHGTVAGMLEHFQACTKVGIVPIPGCEVYFRTNRLDHTPRKVPGKKQPNKMVSIAPQRWHLTLLAMNGIGWKNLQAIVSESYDSGLYYKPTVDFELLTRYSEGIYCLLGCIGGQFSHHIQSGGMYLPQYISTMQSIFKDRISAEIMPHDFDGQRQLNIDTINVCNDYSIPVVATGDTHYPTIEWAKTQDVLLMLSTRQSHNKREKAEDAGEDIYTMHQDNPTLWLMSADEIAMAFAQFHPMLPANVVDAAIDHSGVIIEQFDPIYFDRDTKMPFIGHEIIDKIDPGELHDPSIDADQVVLDTLTRWCSEGLKEIQEIYPPEHWQKFPLATYEQRINREIGVLQKVGMHAVRYMLMVAGECRWARKNDVVIGPGRGSAAGSLVAYLSGITDIDPIPYKLKFERFINENRKGMPDIDIDFMPGAEGRDKVKGHTADVYGHDNVIDIAAYGTYGPRSAIESVCRVFDDVIDYQEAMRYKNAIDLKPTDKADLEECAERFDEIATFKNVYPEIWDIACRIEGHPYSQSVHASGVLVKPSAAEMPTAAKIDKKTGARSAITAWPDTRELLAGYGWLKIDYLVIEGLVRQHQIMKAMRERENTPIDLRRLAVRWDPEAVDPEVMQSFAEGRTLGVWQFEGKGTIPVLKAVKPTNMHDIAAVNALIRPGARDSVNEYAERKNGITPESEWYWHESFEPILKSTYGLLVYQEQVMEIVQEIAGFTPAEADDLRKAMGKKYREGMGAVIRFLDELGYGPKWMDGASPTLGEKLAGDVWEAIVRRGEYNFNACLTGDTVVVRGGAGGRGSKNATTPEITIAELYEAQESDTPWGKKLRNPNRGLKLTQMDQDGRIRLGQMKRVIYNGRREVYEIVTENGRTIRATANHRFLTDCGYKHVDEISSGSMLVVVGEKEPPTSQRLTGRGKGHVAGETYDGQGFQIGQDNPAWLDGRTQALAAAQHEVGKRAGYKCERCLEIFPLSGHALEFAHEKTLEQCGGDYLRFHSASNIVQLCNSCHKKLDYDKGERKKRWTRGLPTELDRVESVTYVGLEAVYDIEMDTPEHNFVANGIVSHNSHAYAYGLISYHDALFKHLMPADFYSWLLSGTDGKDLPKKLSATMREGAKVNLSITPPDINHSLMNFKVLDKQTILYGLESVKGVGPTGVTAIFEHRPYTSYQDFCDRVPARAVNKNAKLALVGSGAFDAFNLRQFMTDQEKASNEIAYIGIKISGISDLVKYGPLIEATIHTEDDFNEAEDGMNLCVGGEITGVKKTMTKKKGESMAFVNLAYGTDEYRVTVFPPVWRLFQNILIEGNVVFFEGTVDISEQYGRGFIGQQCVTLEELVSLDSKRDGAPVA